MNKRELTQLAHDEVAFAIQDRLTYEVENMRAELTPGEWAVIEDAMWRMYRYHGERGRAVRNDLLNRRILAGVPKAGVLKASGDES